MSGKDINKTLGVLYTPSQKKKQIFSKQKIDFFCMIDINYIDIN